MNLNNILLMAQPQGGEQSPYSGLIMMVLIIAVFYFFFIRPQQKKNKEIQNFRKSLSRGDKIVTIGGIHGKILEVHDTTVIIEVEGQNRLKVNKDAITKDGSGQPMQR
jgi:preprotein translocase subunit YajC